MINRVLTIGFLFGMVGLLHAQKNGSENLRHPIVARAPAFAMWTVQYQYEAPKAGATNAPTEDRIVTVVVTKTGNTYWEQAALSSGKKYDKWIIEGLQLKSVPRTEAIVPLAAPSATEPSPDYSDYSKSDFPELSWITAGVFKGPVKYQGRDALYFETSGKSAYLAADTQLPIFSKDAELSRTYTFGRAPTTALVPPPRFQEVIKSYKNAVQGLKFRTVPL